jgi:hypothetical protein
VVDCVGECKHSYAAHGNGGAFGEIGVSVLVALRTFMSEYSGVLRCWGILW